MKTTQRLVATLLVCAAGGSVICRAANGPTAASVVAWVRFEKARHRHADTPYLWLGHGNIELTIDVRPEPGQVLELLWGCKNDTRGGVAVVNGREVSLSSSGYDGFKWLTVPAGKNPKTLDRYEITLKRDSTKAGFIAAVRLKSPRKAPRDPPDRDKTPAYKITVKTPVVPVRPRRPVQSEAFSRMRPFWDRPAPPPTKLMSDQRQEAAFNQAELHGRQANEAFFRCGRFVEGWLKHADPKTGLIPRNLNRNRDIWNAKDSAADNYPFMVLTSAMTDRKMFDGRMLDMLRTETKLTSRLGRLPDTWSFSKQGFASAEPNLQSIIFGGSEYVKDGLLAVTEWLGPSPWSQRMVGIIDDIWARAPVKTPRGMIPSTDPEVNGEMLQALSRVYWMTGEKKYLDYAIRLGDYYLLDGHDPLRGSSAVRLIAHGGEVFSGLAELYATVSVAAPKKRTAYRKPIHAMFNRLLEIGRNSHGMIYASVDPKTGKHRGICDTWGYTYNGVYTLYLVDKTPEHLAAVRKPLNNLKQHYSDHHWGSADEYADTVEGGINLLNREPIASVGDWIDTTIVKMWSKQRPDGVIEGWHGDGNNARTSLMYALWKTRGLTVRNWRQDVRFGAVQAEHTLYITIRAEKKWSGHLLFDKQRHKVNLHLPMDYPRLNQLPEWFTTQADKRYTVRNVTAGGESVFIGKQLQDGLEISLTPGAEMRLIVTRQGSAAAKPPLPKPADPKAMVKKVADAVLRDFPKPPPFNWGEGVMLSGMMRAYHLTKDQRYLKFVRNFADHWRQQGIVSTLRKRGYCGHWGPGHAMLMLYEVTKDKRHLALAEQIIAFMLDKAERTKDGGLSHFNGRPQLWVDTLDMCCPVFSHAARIKGEPKLQAEAVSQLEVFAKHLQDPKTGLFYHMWDERSGKRTPSYWARGNGWVVMSYTEVLKHAKANSPARKRLTAAFEKQLASIVRLQDRRSGLWRTVLDQPDTYLETSASAMFLFALAECGNRKLADAPYAETMRRAWAGLSKQVDARGRVIGVSAGTGPSGKSGYVARKAGTYTWGTGAFLHAACSYAESGLQATKP
ncbi:MAG: glycoside hydrolase family 88 protein [Phycisphaerae bacterium]|nr:glycoside hydrolase family 88 protein [Phycisphaerae bacterium]